MFLLFLFLASCGAGTSTSTKFAKLCHDFNLPVTITTTNYVWGRPIFKNNYDVVDFIQDFNRRDFLETFSPVSGTINETATYIIGGTYCEPRVGKSATVLVATHGAGLDRSYWDSPFQSHKYSFTDFAIERGYSIVAYDRLGSGNSTKPDGYACQMSQQIPILEELVSAIRSGQIHSPTRQKPSKVVLIGHSYGSGITNAVMRNSPKIADAAILAGWGLDNGLQNVFGLTFATMNMKIARTVATRWRMLDTGYLASPHLLAFVIVNFKAHYYHRNAARHLQNTINAIPVGESASMFAVNFTSPEFTAPVLSIVGEYDFFMCGGYCPGIWEPAAASLFPNSKGFEAYIQPNASHMMNFDLNATGAFEVMTNFLAKNGL